MPISSAQVSEPYVPLRKASARQLRSRQSAPRPLFEPTNLAEVHQVRGFNPSPVQATPGLANLTASNEHAFAGKGESRRRPFNLPLSEQTLQEASIAGRAAHSESDKFTADNGPPSSPLVPSPPSPRIKYNGLRSHRSFGDGIRGLKHRFVHDKQRTGSGEQNASLPPLPLSAARTEVRDSFRSATTAHSSVLNTSSIYTTNSSWTGYSSSSDFVNVYPNWPETEIQARPVSMTVDDAIGMYEEGFESDDDQPEKQPTGPPRTNIQYAPHHKSTKSFDQDDGSSSRNVRPRSQPNDAAAAPVDQTMEQVNGRASGLQRMHSYHAGLLKPTRSSSQQKRTFSQILAPNSNKVTRPTSSGSITGDSARDRYGFKKASLYVTLEQYDAWDVGYAEHIERRTKKWEALMKSYGLSTDKPFRFPPKSDKIKRYVRKGIPPDLRGAAWFWYAGGPSRLANDRGLYHELLEDVKRGKLAENDREHIERDLHRTFPDNIRFKPDADSGVKGASGGAQRKGSRATSAPEAPILGALRRVLQAFAVHNPEIGYCQSLNFLAGLLLLFLDEDEEKAFTLMNIVTSTHLPGTHGVALEGANIDIAVLMSCIRDSLPAVWAKLDDKGQGSSMPASVAGSVQVLRLPTVSLATTAWFMSLFVGTLPIESVLRVWDCLFFEGSKTLFRVALAIFKSAEPQIVAVADPMEIFQLVQSIPRSMLDINSLLDVCFRRRGGFAHVSQEMIERRRAAQRRVVQEGLAGLRTDDSDRSWKRFRAKSRV